MQVQSILAVRLAVIPQSLIELLLAVGAHGLLLRGSK